MNNLEHTNPEFLHEQGDDKKNLIQNIHRNLKNKLGENQLATLASQSTINNKKERNGSVFPGFR